MLATSCRRWLPALLAAAALPATAANPPFELSRSYHLPSFPAIDAGNISVVAAEVTQDGLPDLLVSFGQVPVTVFVAQPAARGGGFQPRPLSAISGHRPPRLDRNLVAAGPPNGTGSSREIVYGDSAHGLRRLQWSGGVANYTASSDRIELPAYAGAVGTVAGFAVADFNGDGRSDVAVLDLPDDSHFDLRDRAVMAWGRIGASAVERSLATVPGPYYLAVADFTNDAAHLPDLLIANTVRDVGLSAYDPLSQQMTLRRTLTLPAATAIYSLAAGDLDGDGDADALVQYAIGGQNRWAIIENRGAEGLVLGNTLEFGGALNHCIADFNADGIADVLVEGRTLELGLGNLRYERTPQIAAELTYGQACADFDGDGFIDFAVAVHADDSTMDLRIYRYVDGWDRLFANGFD
ncbi:FG-GAP repeat domain-containing protein [Tahibacter sp. UC22_41]|uniref:FG-GAP repeat domain-containing protein n=1 Tax=Tahibacter sp. UC22_41 TaxID=3350178 RepID=UPI0036D9A5EB